MNVKEKRETNKCRKCKNNKGLIKKYNIYLCRRCFKEVAQRLGFKKY